MAALQQRARRMEPDKASPAGKEYPHGSKA